VGDKTFKQKSLERVNGIRESAGAVVMATHQPAEIRESCNYAMWLKDGRVMLFGDPEEVIEEYESADGSRRDTVERRTKQHGTHERRRNQR